MDLRPNRQLQHSEKNYKIYLKQLLKEQHVLYKYTMRYQQAVRRKDRAVAHSTLRDLEQLTTRIQEMHPCSIDRNHDDGRPHALSSMHYAHILNDPFITQNHITPIIEGVDRDRSSNDNDMAASTSSTALGTARNTSNDTNRNQQTSSKERVFVERFYQQLLKELSSSSFTKQQPRECQVGTTMEIHMSDDTHTPFRETTSPKHNEHWNHQSDDNHSNDIQTNETIMSSETCRNTVQHPTIKIAHATTYAVTRELLRNMTKGTQHIDQFDNYYALLGYTRHKFIERAMLVVSSLNQILQVPSSPISSSSSSSSPKSSSGPSHQRIVDDISLKQWKQRILSVRTMTSIGCGPGCDAVGVVAVLVSSFAATGVSPPPPAPHIDDTTTIPGNDTTVAKDSVNDEIKSNDTEFILDRIVLLDWAMEQWYHPIVQCVSNMLASPPQQHVKSILCETCDVRHPVDQQRSSETKFFTSPRRKDHTPDHNDEHLDDESCVDDNEWRTDTDLVVISYLLSETRNVWHTYMDDYIRRYCKVGTLFLITDPTAWQLHIFRQRYEYDNSEQHNNCNAQHHTASDVGIPLNSIDDDMRNAPSNGVVNEPEHQQPQRRVLMEFQWLDSSMYRPELQELEGRNGPGVLLAMKVANGRQL